MNKIKTCKMVIKFSFLIFTILLSSDTIAKATEEGTLRWSYPCWTNSYVVDDNGIIYATCGNLTAINPDGSNKWEIDVECSKNLSIGDDGTIYLTTCDGLYAIRPDRSQKWKYPVTRVEEDPRPIAIGIDGTIYFVADRELYAIHPNGNLKWVFSERFAGDVGLAIGADGTIYASSGDLYAIRPNGLKKWRKSSAGGYSQSIIFGSDGTIYVPCECNVEAANLEAINPDGTRKWLAEFSDFDCQGAGNGDLDNPVVDTDGTIVVVGGLPMAFVNPANGSYSCRSRDDTSWENGVTIGADGFIYHGWENYHGTIFLEGPGWSLPLCYNSLGIITITEDGVLYVNEAGWNNENCTPSIHAVNVNSKGLAKSSWPMPGHDERQTYRADKSPIDELVSANFNHGTQGFTYRDDTFRRTNRPAYAKGDRTAQAGYGGTGGLHVCIGNVDYKWVLNGMSGGWSKDFYLQKESDLNFSLNYRIMTSSYDADECGEALVAIDGDIVMELAKRCYRGKDTGWQTETFNQVLPKGNHTLTVGAYGNKKTGNLEKTDAYFDDISITIKGQSTPEIDCGDGKDNDGDGDTDCDDSDCADSSACNGASIFSVGFDTGEEGFDYEDDMFHNTSHPPYAAGDWTATSGHSNSGGLHLTLGNVDGVDILNGMSGGWSESFAVDIAGNYEVTLKYRIVMNRFDADECAKALVQIDNGDVKVLQQLCYRGKDTGWKTKTFIAPLSAGDHTIKIGGYCNKKTGPLESAHIYFDDFEIK